MQHVFDRKRWIGWSLAMAVFAAGCTRFPPEQALRQEFGRLEQAVEARDANRLAVTLAEDFAGPEGMDRDQARRFAALMFLRHREVGVTTGPLTIAMEGERARVGFIASVSGGSGSALADSMQTYRVEMGWRLQGGDWRLVSAHWTPQFSSQSP